MSAERSNDSRSERSVRLTDAPRLSVVVVSCGDRAVLRGFLEELLPLCAPDRVEVLVVCGGNTEEARDTGGGHPAVSFVLLPRGATLESLRSAGMAEAAGDVVLLAADDDPAARDRLLHLLRCHARPATLSGIRAHVPASEPI